MRPKTVNFDVLTSIPACGHKLTLIPMPDEPRTYRIRCKECEGGVKIIEAKMELKE